jgi:hypothetical protein
MSSWSCPLDSIIPPSTFQSLMNPVFHPFLHHFFLVFFNDILIYSKTWQAYLTHVDQFLHLLSKKKKKFSNGLNVHLEPLKLNT